MIGLGIIENIRASIIRKRKVDYPTACPSKDDYLKAGEILQKVNGYKGNPGDLKDIVSYLLKYHVIEDWGRSDNPLKVWSRAFATAPWMANENNDYYVAAIQFLLTEKILRIRSKYKLVLNGTTDKYEKVELNEVSRNAGSSYERVCNYIYGKGKGDFLTLKISTFHARTYTNMNSDNNLIHLMDEYPNLRIQVLCVGKHSGKVARENADDAHLNQAVKTGMLRLYNLAFWRRNQFKIRIIKDDIVDASLRCVILMDRNHIEFCEFDVSRTGYERGNQGKIFKADARSSIALQINSLFDQAFERAIPARRNLEWFIYMLKKGGRIFFLLMIASIINFFVPRANGGRPIPAGSGEEFVQIFLTALITVVLDKIGSAVTRKYLD